MSRGVQRIFSQVPHTYETVNHVLTLGLDILWRRQAAKVAASCRGSRWLEVCSGTGQMSFLLDSLATRGTRLIATDFSLPMLLTARRKPKASRLHLALCDALRLPFPDDSFDLVAVSFATRNINLNRTTLIEAFSEFCRVLKPGGMLINLETSQPPRRIIRWLFHQYLRLVVRPVGHLISGSRVGYGYLSQTARHFYHAEELRESLFAAGFTRVDFHCMAFGVVAIHRALK